MIEECLAHLDASDEAHGLVIGERRVQMLGTWAP